MPSIPEKRQYRNMMQLRTADENTQKRFDTEYYVEGYASTFNDPYVLWQDFDGIEYKEQIDPNAFKETDMGDIIMQYDHSGKVFARKSNGTLIVEPDEHGLFIAADLSRSEAARNLYEEIKNGLITRMSWAFTIRETAYDRETHTTTITKVEKIYDVSAVSLPADPNTEISARNLLNGVIESQRKEFARNKKALLRAKACMALNRKEK